MQGRLARGEVGKELAERGRSIFRKRSVSVRRRKPLRLITLVVFYENGLLSALVSVQGEGFQARCLEHGLWQQYKEDAWVGTEESDLVDWEAAIAECDLKLHGE